MYTAPIQLLHLSSATSADTCCLPQSVVASWMSENTGLCSSLPKPWFHCESFSCSCIMKLYGSCSRMNDPRKNEGVKMESTGASRESSRSHTTTSFRLRCMERHFAAASARMRLPRPFTAWITRKPVGSRVSVSLKLSGFMTYP